MTKKKVLLIGPLPKPITGESICNELIATKLEDFSGDFKVDVIDTAHKSFHEQIGNFSLWKVLAGIKPYFKSHKIFKNDIVYITIGQTFLGVLKYAPFLLLADFLNKEIIIHVHGNYLGQQYQNLKGIKRKIFKKLIQKAQKGIVLSGRLKANLLPFLNEKKIYVLHNFVERNLLEISLDEIKNKDTSKLKIVFLSNLMTEKGIFDLLESLKQLAQQNMQFEAHIAGNIDPAQKNKFLKYIKQIPNLKYWGVVRGKEKKQLLLSSNVFVFPSYYKLEGQPIALLEAMATGNIVLTTKHGGIPDIFSEKNGFFIQKKSPDSITSKLIMISQKLPTLKPMMLENSLYVKNNFSEEKFLDNLSSIFKA